MTPVLPAHKVNVVGQKLALPANSSTTVSGGPWMLCTTLGKHDTCKRNVRKMLLLQELWRKTVLLMWSPVSDKCTGLGRNGLAKPVE